MDVMVCHLTLYLIILLSFNIVFDYFVLHIVYQTGRTVALKKVALRKLEDGIPNQALREIKALQEIEDNQHVSITGLIVWERYQRLASFSFSPGSQA